MRKLLSKSIILALAVSLLFVFGCSSTKKEAPKQKATPTIELKLATTTSTTDTGLLDYLLPVFEKKYNIKVKVISVGSGQAIATAQKGDADVLLVHSPKAEEQFVTAGFGVDRQGVMHNDFVIVGPANDPAGIKQTKTAIDAFTKIANSKVNFVARGDASGTDTKEKGIWEKAKIKPTGTWYIAQGGGMAATLRMASEKGAYTLSDRGTYLAQKAKLKLTILVEGDKDLLNTYHVIVDNPQKFPNVKYDAAKKFEEFMTSTQGQKLIADFGKDKFGQSLFFPDVVKQ